MSMAQGSWGPELGFTLIEMLVVLTIVVVMLGFVMGIPTSDQREEHVRGAAEELAAVLRETRTRAIRKNTPYGVVFNIQNAPGSSGRILNNRSGGHYYRLIGPRDTHGGLSAGADWSDWNDLPWPRVGGNDPVPLRPYLELVSRSITTDNYVNHELRKANGSPLGIPVHDTVLPEMLRERKWWWKTPASSGTTSP